MCADSLCKVSPQGHIRASAGSWELLDPTLALPIFCCLFAPMYSPRKALGRVQVL